MDEETFELVQKFISVKKRPNKTGRPNMFVGLVKCPDCGRNMAFSNPNGKEPRFRCRTYARNSNLCTTHAISYDALQQIVMGDIQKHIKSMEALGDQFIEEMHHIAVVFQDFGRYDESVYRNIVVSDTSNGSGHASTSVTLDTYTHLTEDKKKEQEAVAQTVRIS